MVLQLFMKGSKVGYFSEPMWGRVNVLFYNFYRRCENRCGSKSRGVQLYLKINCFTVSS